MTAVGLLDGFALGVLGGIIPEIFALYKLRHTFKAKTPPWIKSGFYWCITAVMVILGGGAVCLYLSLGINVNPLIAIHIGMSTPLLITTFQKTSPRIS